MSHAEFVADRPYVGIEPTSCRGRLVLKAEQLHPAIEPFKGMGRNLLQTFQCLDCGCRIVFDATDNLIRNIHESE